MSDATVAVAAAAAAAAPAPALQTFEGQVVIIFGASRHLGRSLAVAFAARGAKLSLFARDADMLERTRQLALEAAGQSSAAGDSSAAARVFCTVGDITRPQDVQKAVRDTVQTFGRIDIAVNNAAYDGDSPSHLVDMDPTVFARVMDVSVNGTFHCMKYEMEHMLQQSACEGAAVVAAVASATSDDDAAAGEASLARSLCTAPVPSRGVIVNIASRYGHVGFPRWGAYAAAKHAVLGLTRTAAAEVSARGVRVCAFSPGAIAAGMIIKDCVADASLAARLKDGIPAKRLASEAEFVAGVLFLASPAAGFVHGSALIMDGGFTAL